MIQIPENVRPYLDIVLRHHFWMLLPLVPSRLLFGCRIVRTQPWAGQGRVG